MRRLRRHEEHSNHEAWAIPYADLLTLLLAFFVVMYAISSVNEGKYRVLSDSLFAAFRGTPRTMQPIQVGEKQVGSGADIHTTIVQQAVLEGQPRSLLAPVPVKDPGLPRSPGDPVEQNVQISEHAAAAAQALSRVADQVEHAMDDLVRKKLVVVRRTDFWIEVEIRTDILFPSGSAQLEPYAADVIERLARTLAPFPNPIRVEGHTDNVPIRTVAFYSNWELSAARAGSVVRVLSSQGVDPNRLAVIGYGQQRPIQSNDTPQGRNANRRVVVVILSTELTRLSDPANVPGEATPGGPTPAALPPATTAGLDPTPAGIPAAFPLATPAAIPAESTPSPASAPTPLAYAAEDASAAASELTHSAVSLALDVLSSPRPAQGGGTVHAP
jgi:chemotaxis protein MotB